MSDQPTPSTEPAAPLTILAGGEQHAAALRDGTSETVTVRLMTMRELQGYLNGIDDISAFVELACAKPTGWADKLAPDSLFALDEAVRRLNDPILDRLIQRQVSAVQKMRPMAAKLAALGSTT
jgi:hypothetical protein